MAGITPVEDGDQPTPVSPLDEDILSTTLANLSLNSDVSADEFDVPSLSKLPLDPETRAKIDNSNELNILVFGVVDSGKSTLINSLLNEDVNCYQEYTREGIFDPTTDDITAYTINYRLEIDNAHDSEGAQKVVKINLYDTPGLQEGKGEKDVEYLQMMERKCPRLDLIIYCTKVDKPLRTSEKLTIKQFTRCFREGIWKHAVVALTYANEVKPPHRDMDKTEYLKKKIQSKRDLLRECFTSEVFDKLRTLEVGRLKSLKLPTVENWKAEFLKNCLEVCTGEGSGALLKIIWESKRSRKDIILSILKRRKGATAIAGISAVAVAVGVAILLATTGGVALIPLIAAGTTTTVIGTSALGISASPMAVDYAKEVKKNKERMDGKLE